MIISHSTLGKNGRLGNQLFQVASTLGLAEKYNAQAAFPRWEYERYFQNEIPHGTMSNNTIQERYFHHHEWEFTGDTDVMGFLQSEKYFGSERLKLDPVFVQEQKMKYPGAFNKETICIHIRRGDYVGNPNYVQLGIGYYLSALLENFPDWMDANLVVCSDDIEYCRVHFGCLPNVTFGTGTDIEDMALASCCDHFILSNGSYSWWCAYLGEKPHSKIIHCGRLHAGRLKNKGNEDYYPERWTAFTRESYKIPLRDLTFTIPVRYDHANRKENLDLCLYLLQSVFDSNYIIMEQGGTRFKYTEQWATYMEFEGEVFHRTRMLNQMCEKSKTVYIANLDCDVLLPPLQIILAVMLLREGSEIVYPYNGGFARMPRLEWYPRLNQALDIGVVGNTPFKRRDAAENSVGGVVFWNKDAFIECGMENEYMISFGPEDVERHNRAKNFGYTIERIGGCLFHLNHHISSDSSPRNGYFNANVLEEQKVTRMGEKELRAYVDTWPWRHPYTSTYRQEISEGSIRSAKIVMEALHFKPKTVIDVGCGLGEWSLGNPDYFGVDYRVDKSKLLFDERHYLEVNLNKQMPPDVSKILRTKFDLAICLEVAEHLKPARAGVLVEYLCSLSDTVLFSAAIPHQGGKGHINEQWQEYWAELFYQNGFGTTNNSVKLVQQVVYNEEVELWYRQNMVLYERGGKGKVTNFVLPEYYEQIVRGLKG